MTCVLFCLIKKGYEGSLLKVTNKNGKNLSPVGFVTFANRVDAETAKQELTVKIFFLNHNPKKYEG